MNEQELFEALVREGVLEKAVADRFLRDAKMTGKPAEQFLYDEHTVDESAVAKVKSKLIKTPYKAVDPAQIPEDVLKLVPYETSRAYQVVPIEKQDKMLVVGMLNPDDAEAQNALTFIAKRERVSLGVYLTTPSVLRAAWRRYMPYETEIEAAVKELGDVNQEEVTIGLEEGAQSAQDAPVIKIVATTLRQAVDAGASDIHIEPQRTRLRLRFRVDGKLHEVASLPVGLSYPIVSRVKVLSRLRLDETRQPQDGRFRSIVFGRDIDFRVSTFPTPSGEKVAIRVLDPTTGLKSIEELGMRPYHIAILKEEIDAPFGMILATGPTSSGKTTSLYAIMRRLSGEDVNAVSLEDPVEYFMEGVNQSQVLPSIGYTFASGLRQILRQDPDVIMVGEIRDGETAELAVHAALTGHIVLSTLHTNNAVGVIPRLVDLGVQGFLLASSLRLMISQRLVGRLCEKCRVKRKAPPEAQQVIEKALEELSEDARRDVRRQFSAPYEIYELGGDASCDACGGKGTKGRVALFEILRMTRELSSAVAKPFTEDTVRAEAERQGMVSLRQDGIIKALGGEVMLEEVMRETEE